jgi:hypothetical protein
VRDRRSSDRLSALIVEIEDFDRHESVPRAVSAIDFAFDVCETFAQQEVLSATLVSMARTHYFAFARVLERLWLNAQKWEAPERGRTLATMAWYLVPSMKKWIRPLAADEAGADLASLCTSETQQFLAQIDTSLWQLVASETRDLALGATMLVGTMQGLRTDDSELLIDAALLSEDPTRVATALLAVGRAGQYARLSQGLAGTDSLVAMLRPLVEHVNTWVGMMAVSALSLLGLPIPALASKPLIRAIEEPLGLPPHWVPSGAFWRDYTSRTIACCALSFVNISPDEDLLKTLRAVPEGKDKKAAILALESVSHVE